MEFIVKDITTPEWVAKKQFYKVVGMEAVDWTMVDIKVFDWEWTKTEIEAIVVDIEWQMEVWTTYLAELNTKLSKFPI